MIPPNSATQPREAGHRKTTNTSNTTRTSRNGILNVEARDIQVLPNDQLFHGAQVEGVQGVLDSEAVPASVLRDLAEVVGQQLLFADELHVR